MNSGAPRVNAPETYLTWRWEDEEEEAAQKLVYVPDQKKPNGGTFVLRKEDHTLGNLIRIQLLRDSKVRFAGYRIPHPLVFEAHVRIETMDSQHKPLDVLQAAIEDLKLEVEAIEKAFERELLDKEKEI